MPPINRNGQNELRDTNRRLVLREEIRLIVAEERRISNESYAIKLVEQIVFGLVTLLLLATVGAVVATVLR